MTTPTMTTTTENGRRRENCTKFMFVFVRIRLNRPNRVERRYGNSILLRPEGYGRNNESVLGAPGLRERVKLCGLVGHPGPAPPSPGNLVEQLVQARPDDDQSPSSQRRGPVEATVGPPVALLVRRQVAFALQAVQHRIQSTRAHLIAMMSKLLDHPETVKFALLRMVQDMHTDKACE
jgi:hypothetical protein